MKLSIAAIALLGVSLVVAQPHRQHQHQHQKHHEKRDVVWVTDVVVVTETIDITTTIWIDGDATPLPPSTTKTTSHATTTSTSSTPSSTTASESPAEFHESPEPSPTPHPTSVSVAPYVAPVPSSSSLYIPPPPSSTYVAPVVETTPVYVPPTSTPAKYVAPVETSQPAPQPTSASSSSSTSDGGNCSPGNPCTGDLTFYTAGLGACGETTDGDAQSVVALPYELMGTQSNGNPFCGKTITIMKGGQSITATVVDKCMGCKGKSIDLSTKAFGSLGIDFSVGRTTGEWYFND